MPLLMEACELQSSPFLQGWLLRWAMLQATEQECQAPPCAVRQLLLVDGQALLV